MNNETQELVMTPVNPGSLISQAIDKGLGVAELEKLMGLQERWEANQARKAFFAAFTDFQSELPDIRKTKQVKFKEADLKPQYSFAPIGSIARQLRDLLKKYRLSYRWRIKTTPDNIEVTCLVSHAEGHTEETTMSALADPSGSKNAIQARGSSVQYLKRYTLEGALGLTTTETDDDGSASIQYDLDRLHKEFMEVYNQVIQLDAKKSGWHPDNWKSERTGKNYVKAIGEIRKVLFELQKHTS